MWGRGIIEVIEKGVMMKEKTLKNLKEWAIIIAVAAVVWFLLTRFVVFTCHVPTPSMVPTIQLEDHIVVDRLFYKMGSLQRGDIIVFKAPEHPGIEKDKWGELMVKRLIGLPGETVEWKNGYVWIDGQALNEPYVIDPEGRTIGWFGPVTVPEGSYFVMGDNRENSGDSRSWGVLDQKRVEGRVWIRYWPFDRFGGLVKPPEDSWREGSLDSER